jgi:hypothetical protein
MNPDYSDDSDDSDDNVNVIDRNSKVEWGDLYTQKVAPSILEVDEQIAALLESVKNSFDASSNLMYDAAKLHQLLTENAGDGEKTGKWLSLPVNEAQATLLRTLWISEPTFYPRVFPGPKEGNSLISKSDELVILQTTALLQDFIRRLENISSALLRKGTAKYSERTIEKFRSRLNRPLRIPRGSAPPDDTIRDKIYEMLKKEALKEIEKRDLTIPKFSPEECVSDMRKRQQETQRQRAILFWAREKYRQIINFLNSRTGRLFIVQKYRSNFETLRSYYEGKKRIELSKLPFSTVDEEIPDIFKLKAIDEWSILYRHLTNLEVRNLLPKELVRDLMRKDSRTLRDVFGDETKLSEKSINCISEWAKTYLRNPAPYLGQNTRRMRFHVDRYKAYLELLREALLYAIKERVNLADRLPAYLKNYGYPENWISQDADTARDPILERNLAMNITSCIGCNGEAAQFCGGCASETAYCSVECQQKDWNNHKHTCDFLHLKQ